MNYEEESLKLHYKVRGKLEITPRVRTDSMEALSLAYTPGVARPCLEIQKDISHSYDLTRRWNTVAVITDGTAVLGLGDIGPEAGMPVMEGKCVLFKAFGDIDAIPLCIRSKDPDTIVNAVSLLAGSFGGINLEDISAPRCFEIEAKLRAKCDIPVFHDDQHGTAIVVLAGVINAMKITGKSKENCRVVVNGAGSAGIAITRLLLRYGFHDITLCDRSGILRADGEGLNPIQKEMAAITNPQKKSGTLSDAMKDADIFIGVSAPGIVTEEMAASMNKDSILFAMANPVPEIMPDKAKSAGVRVIGTGRSDFPNQVNNVLVFPGIFRGALDVRASTINEEMELAAANALAGLIPPDEMNAENILPKAFDPQVRYAVAKAVAEAARQSGVARLPAEE